MTRDTIVVVVAVVVHVQYIRDGRSDMLHAERSEIRTPVGERNVCLLQNHPDRQWGQPSFLYNSYVLGVNWPK